MKIISIFIISFILLSFRTTGYTAICPPSHPGMPVYYCNCQPATGGTCQCNASNGHPIVDKENQPVGNIAIGPKGAVAPTVCCTVPGNIIPDSIQPPIQRINSLVQCLPWQFSSNVKFATVFCGNSSLYTNYIRPTGFNCTNSG